MEKKIGFIGLGNMGKPMAKNLMKAGFELVVRDTVKDRVRELVELGATAAGSPKEVAESSAVIITSLMDSSVVYDVVLGAEGLIKGIRPGTVLIDMSTVEPSCSRKIASLLEEKGVKILDAPVSGGAMGAENATLTIMVGGDRDVYEENIDVLKAMGKKIFYCGKTGCGAITKLCNNLVGAVSHQASGEAMVLGVKAGVDPEILHNVITSSTGQNWQLEHYFPLKVYKGDFEPVFKAELMYKDLNLALATASELGVPLMLGAVCRGSYGFICAAGKGKEDFGTIIKSLEEVAGVKVRIPKDLTKD